MKLVQIYKCFCDELRLRILNLLKDGPLCVCHLVEILDCDQIKMSKQLRYMKELGMVESSRQAQWMVYRLADANHPLLQENLKCLQDYASDELSFSADIKMRKKVIKNLRAEESACASVLLSAQSG
ncbi:metalloregulator ArsR/SmtB family transcription factor [Puniceicoccaceae bacterium K14]|nr:metalloregulator ArsR/SmtB family transcription factor [Puniceicoccaceae bacterium K14]